MNTREINELLKNTKHFIGTFPRDIIPRIPQRPAYFVINTDDSYNPGQHWVSIILKTDGSGEYFDSFGLPPLQSDLIKFLLETCPKGFVYNTVTLQNTTTATCGLYCILFIKQRNSGQSFCEFLSQFSSQTKHNDNIISKIVHL